MKHNILFLVLAVCSHTVMAQLTDTIDFETSTWITDEGVPPNVVQSTRSFRERLIADPYRPAFHFAVPEGDGSPGDPNGAFYANGRYHLMYLYKREGTGFSWGHVSSKDMLHWRHHPDAIVPTGAEDGIFSGGAFVGKDDKVTLSYWQFVEQTEEAAFKEHSAKRGKTGIALTQSTDEHFDSWEKISGNPVVTSTEWGITTEVDSQGNTVTFGSADPSNIWYDGGKYYMLTGNLTLLNKLGRHEGALEKYKGDHAYLFVSDDMKNWKYLHEFYTRDNTWTDDSEDSMCASFLPLPTAENGGKPSGKHLLLFISHNKGAQYYIGSYANEKFKPETHGRMSWIDNAYFAPEALMDNQGRQIMWSWMFDDRPDSVKKATGWTGSFGLPRTLWLGEDQTLRMAPVNELAYLRQQKKERKEITVSAGSEYSLDEMGSELMELEMTIDLQNSRAFSVIVGADDSGKEKTVISYDVSRQRLEVDTRESSLGYGRKTVESAPLVLKAGEPLRLRIFMDRSVVEVFANERQAIARSIYPTLGGRGVRLISKEGSAHAELINAWEIMPSNPY